MADFRVGGLHQCLSLSLLGVPGHAPPEQFELGMLPGENLKLIL